jgi:hypothetical protein
MKAQVLVALIAALMLTLISCSGGNSPNNNSENNVASIPASDQDVVTLAQYFQGEAQSELQNTANGQAIVSGSATSIEFSDLGVLLTPESGCMTVDSTASGADKEVLFIFICNSITGTLDVSSTIASTTSYDLVTKITLVDPNDTRNIERINSENTVSASSGVLTINKTFDNTFTNSTDSYEIKGTTSYVVNTTNSTISLSSSITYFKDGSSMGAFTISSSGLEYASCGLDAGTLTIKNGVNTYIATFSSGCGNPTWTKNGSPMNP